MGVAAETEGGLPIGIEFRDQRVELLTMLRRPAYG